MKSYNSGKLIRLMVFISIAGFFFVSIALIFIFTTTSLENYKISIQSMNVQYGRKAKVEAEEKIQKLTDFIKIYETMLRQKQKEKVKNSLEFGIDIINNIYMQYKSFPKKIILQKIRDELIHTRFFNDKTGYFFIYTLKGDCILSPAVPHAQGTNQINFLDGKKEYLIKKFINIVKSKKEGFTTWYWHKIGEKKINKKLGYVKIFKPLDIFIGTGRYEEDMIKSVKQKIKQYLQTLKNSHYGYIFAYDLSGNSIKDGNKHQSINRWNDITEGRHIIRDAIRGAIINPSGFLMDYMSKAGDIKVSYIRLISELNWIIGTNVEDIKEIHHKQEVLLKNNLYKTIYKTIFISIIVLLLMVLGFLILSFKIKNIFKFLENTLTSKNQEIKEQQNIFETLFDKSHDGILLSKNKKIIDCNEAMLKMVCAKNKQEFLNIKIEKLFPEFQEDGKKSLEKLETMFDVLKEKGYHQFEFKAITLEGEELWVNLTITELRLNGERIGYFILRDITRRKKIEEKLKIQQQKLFFQAKHDSLTSLPNRLLLMDRLSQNIKKAIRNKKMMAVIFLDIDNFKNINDIFGHDNGDILLAKVATILSSQVRSTDTVARLGGDEFAIVLDDLSHISDSSFIIQKILKQLQSPFILENNSIKITCSLGVAIFPNDAKDEHTLLRYADMAMYRAKEEGKNRYLYFDESMNKHMLAHIKIEKELRDAIKNDEFVLHYQSQIDIQTKQIIGFEALIRWNHPQLGLVYPDYFIQIAEGSDLIIDIGNIVLKKAMLQMKWWNEEGFNPGIVSVNFATKQLEEKGLFDTFENLLKETNCKIEWIEIEVLERFIMKDTQKSINTLNYFKSLGAGIAIDDFGTGYSSMNYLKHLPITKLKIDKSFIDDIVTNKKDKAITKSIIDLSKGLDLKVLAEGVETKEQNDVLSELGCEIIQGYYFSKPLPKEEIDKILQNDKLNR